MGRPKSIISKSELAAVLGLSRGRISQLCQREDFPSRTDGRIDRERAVRWYRDAGLAEQGTKRGPKPPQRAAVKPARAAQPSQSATEPLTGPCMRRVAVGVLQHIAAPKEVLEFARVAQRAGCTAEQTYIVARQFFIQPSVNLPGLSCDDLADVAFPEPTATEWRNLLGQDFDFEKAEVLHDKANWPEIDPARKPAA
jgi:predicted DNA-binding transcriptional regulator AlpA